MIVVVKKRNILLMLVLIVLFCCFVLCFSQNEVVATMNNTSVKKVPIYKVSTTTKKVALTFDAAWGADKTEGILEIAKQHGIDVTFFLVGFWIDKYPEMVKKIYENGCDIGNHTLNHFDLTTINTSEVLTEITSVNEKIKSITGITPRLFRFPYGSYNSNVVQNVEDLGLIPIQCSVDSLDWKGLSADDIITRVKNGVTNGAIILFHNNSDNILEALPQVISILKNDGYELVKLSDLVYMENYSVDVNGIQHKNTI